MSTPQRLRRALTGLALLLPLAACSSDGDGQMTDEQLLGYYLENAFRYYDLGDYNRALDQANNGLEIDPDNERLLLVKARCHLLRDTKEDLLIAEQILRDHPAEDDHRVHMCLGLALERKGLLYDTAAIQIRSGQRYTDAPDPEQRADELHGLAIATWEEAVVEYERSNELMSGVLEPLNGLMRTQAYLEDSDASLAAGQRLIEAIEVANRMREQELDRLQNDTERDTLPLQRTIYDNNVVLMNTHVHMAEELYGQERYDEALAHLDAALAIDPDWSKVHSRRALLFYRMEEYERALESAQRFVRLSTLPFEHPDIRRANDLISECEQALKERREAEAGRSPLGQR